MTKPDSTASKIKEDSIDNDDSSSHDLSSVSSNEKLTKLTQMDSVPQHVNPNKNDMVPQPVEPINNGAVPQAPDKTSVPTPDKPHELKPTCMNDIPDLNPKPVPEEVEDKPDINSKPPHPGGPTSKYDVKDPNPPEYDPLDPMPLTKTEWNVCKYYLNIVFKYRCI